MSVLIKGMEMPKSCYDCDLAFQDQDSEHNVYWLCGVNHQNASMWERLPNCPLIELPPHGRLIDADNLLTDKSINIIGKGMIFGGQYVFSESEIVNAPTIIPAEPPKEEMK